MELRNLVLPRASAHWTIRRGPFGRFGRGETHARTKSLSEDLFLVDNLTVVTQIEIDVYSIVRVYLVPSLAQSRTT